ncbi:MAG: DUF3846 domain-containing protein [Salinibacterium sp.]|nr:DUF3846 domain-containing protein [Salinibacterium sp.]
MVTGIVIPHDITKALQKVEFQNLADYQAAVGGYIETIQLDDHPLLIVANEEGKIGRLPLNERATCLWWLLNPAGLGGDELVGDVVLLGPIKRGEITSAPEKIVALILESKRFQVQVRLSQEFDTWVPIGKLVDDFFEATLRALRLMEVWSPPGDVNVVASE